MAKQIQLAIAPIAWTNDDMPELLKRKILISLLNRWTLLQMIMTQK